MAISKQKNHLFVPKLHILGKWENYIFEICLFWLLNIIIKHLTWSVIFTNLFQGIKYQMKKVFFQAIPIYIYTTVSKLIIICNSVIHLFVSHAQINTRIFGIAQILGQGCECRYLLCFCEALVPKVKRFKPKIFI